MSKSFCKSLFVVKCLLAILFALALFYLMGTKVYNLRIEGVARKAEEAPPVTIDPTRCGYNSNLARLEPPPGERLFGFHLDWNQQRPSDIRGILGRNPAVINAFLRLNSGEKNFFDFTMLNWHADEVQKGGAILALTIEPSDIDNVPMEQMEAIAQAFLKINEKGVPMFLRFGHEMNAYWTAYGMQPRAYISGFRKMATVVRRYTNMTAMVWGPNVGSAYPFSYDANAEAGILAKINDPANLALLDTNKNNKIDEEDDPYTPYYPGDDYVDWFALSLYYYPDKDSEFNQAVPLDSFVKQLTGPDYSKRPILDNFYKQFPEKSRKPMMIPETGAPFFPDMAKGLPEVQLKEPWWQQLYSDETFARFPNLKLIVHFEEKKLDSVIASQAHMRDWRILADPSTRDAFIKDLNALGKKVLGAQDIKYVCDGSIALK